MSSSSSSSSASTDNVVVAVRVRPFNKREKNANRVVFMEGDTVRLVNPNFNSEDEEANNEKQEYTFEMDYAYDSFDPKSPLFASQDTLCRDVAPIILQKTFDGFNSSIFAYGQTGSGKSYSMLGPSDNPGIIPRVAEELFNQISQNNDSNMQYEVQVSFLEIYNEKVQDLFVHPKKRPKKGLKVRNHPKKGPYAQGLRKIAVDSYADVKKAMQNGNRLRTVAATKMNATSSRSHSVFSIELTQRRTISGAGASSSTDNGGDRVEVVTSVISLVDLAGSERQSNTGAKGQRLKEACAINQSLSALGNVISALASMENQKNSENGKKKKKKKYIPYRDSILTKLLQSSLGGNSFTIMIAAVSPADMNFEESLSTLRYADRAASIVNQLVKQEPVVEQVQQDNAQHDTEDLRKEIETKLKASMENKSKQEARKHARQIEALKKKLKEAEQDKKEMQKSFKEKLAVSKQFMKEQDQAMKDMGLSVQEIGSLSGADVNQPYLFSLAEDATMSGCLMYFFDQDGTTTLGSGGRNFKPDIRLKGRKIQSNHCLFEWDHSAQKMHVTPMAIGRKTNNSGDFAPLYINGKTIEEQTELCHNDRLIIGAGMVFRVVIPQQAGQGSQAAADWEAAVDELAAVQGKIRQEDLDRERELEEKIAELQKEVESDEAVQEENAKLEAQVEEAQKELDAKKKALLEQKLETQELQKQMHKIEQEANKQIAEAQKHFAQERDQLTKEKSDLIHQLKQQQQELKALEKRAKDLSHMLEVVDEANDMVDEMDIDMLYVLEFEGDIEDLQMQDAEIKATSTRGGLEEIWAWSVFEDRLDGMREAYQQFVENDVPCNAYTEDNPFLVFPPDQELTTICVSLAGLDIESALEDVVFGDDAAKVRVTCSLEHGVYDGMPAVLNEMAKVVIDIEQVTLDDSVQNTHGLFVSFDFPPAEDNDDDDDDDDDDITIPSTTVVSERSTVATHDQELNFRSEFVLDLDQNMLDALAAMQLNVKVFGHEDPLANDPEILHAELDKAQLQNQKITTIQTDLMAKLAALESENDKLEMEKVTVEKENDTLESETDRLKRELAAANKRAEEAEKSKGCLIL